MAPIFSGSTYLNRFFAVALIGVGAAGVGLQAAWLADRSSYVGYVGVVSSVTGLAPPGTGLDVAIAGAAIVIVGGVISLAASFGKSNAMRYLFMAGLIIGILGGIVELAGGLIVSGSSYYKALGPDTYVFNEAKPEQQLQGDQAKMAMFGLAVFDKCCRPANWSGQAQFADCAVSCPSPQSGEFTNDDILQFQDSLPAETIARLCTCVRPGGQNQTYTTYYNTLTTGSCDSLKAMKIDFKPDLIIPTTPINLGFVKNRLYPDAKIVKVPLIGFFLEPSLDPLQQTPEGFGFGCGLGYPKGVMWMQELYHDFYIKPAASSGLGLGIAAIVVSILAFLLGYFVSRDDGNSAAGNWENTLAAKWNEPTDVPVAAVAKVDDSSAWSSPNPMSSVPVAASSGDPLMSQLTAFYGKHDPLKSKKEIEGIAQYANQNGVAALNKKLREKYGVDLGGGDSDPPI